MSLNKGAESEKLEGLQFLQVAELPFRKILNYLEIRSFVRFPRTCKTAHRRWTNTKKNGIKIVVAEDSIKVEAVNDGPLKSSFYANHHGPYNEGEAVEVEEQFKKWEKLPCELHLKHLEIFAHETIDFSVLTEVHDFLQRFKIKQVYKVNTYSDVSNWHEFINFLGFFKVRSLVNYIDGDFPAELHQALFNLNLTELDCPAKIPDELLLSRLIPDLSLSNANMSPTTMKFIIQKFLTTNELTCWEIGSSSVTEDDFISMWKEYYVCPFDYEGELPDERPLVFSRSRVDDYSDKIVPQFVAYTADNGPVVFERCPDYSDPNNSIICFRFEMSLVPPCIVKMLRTKRASIKLQ